MAKNAESAAKDFTFQHYVVAVIDLLAQSNTLVSLCNLPSDDTSYTRFLDAARETVGRILQVRSCIQQYFDGFLKEKTPAHIALLPAEKAEQYSRLKSISLTTQQFSDTIVAYSPVRSPVGDVTVSGAYATLAAYSGVTLLSLVLGIPLRGGIDVSIAVELGQQDIYGPALMNAYNLEHTVAKHVRIVVGDGLIKFLNDWNARSEGDIRTRLNKALAARCLSMISVDTDGANILDYLGPTAREKMPPEMYASLTKKAYSFVQSQYASFEKSGDEKLASRYAQVIKYFESKAHDVL